uniref:DUF3847 domain-containing protein n=1 Tax=Caenorhabditis tropicalis TaxID=1561998 RepID=A0A1I7UWI7_9PELO
MISPLLASFEGNMNYEEYIKKCGEEAVKKKIEEEAKTLKRKSTREESGPVLKAVKQEVIEPWEEEFAHGKEN